MLHGISRVPERRPMFISPTKLLLVNSRTMATIPEETNIALRHGSGNPIPDPDPNRPFTAEELHRIALHESVTSLEPFLFV